MEIRTFSHEEQAENRKKWVEALRSGDYEQAIGRLRSPDGYCCLGVACDISGLGVWQDAYDPEDDLNDNPEDRDRFTYFTNESNYGYLNFLPPSVCEWLGINDIGGQYSMIHATHEEIKAMTGKTPKNCTLTELNDDHIPFDKIADVIESEPKGMFE